MLRLEHVMNDTVTTIGARESADAAWNLMKMKRIHHLVVVQSGEVVGVLTDRDLGGRNGAKQRDGRLVGDLMSRLPLSAPPEMSVRQAARLLKNRSIGCLPVLAKGRLCGIVTVSDLLEILGRGHAEGLRERPTLSRRGPRRGPRRASSWGYPR